MNPSLSVAGSVGLAYDNNLLGQRSRVKVMMLAPLTLLLALICNSENNAHIPAQTWDNDASMRSICLILAVLLRIVSQDG
jgi:hypothetical protein